MPYDFSLLGIAGADVQAAAAPNLPAMDIADLPHHSIRSAVPGHLSKEDGV